MAFISVDLSEVTRPVTGDIRKVLDEIIGRLLDLVFCELDSYYGNNDWCTRPKVYAFPGPYPKITINMEISDNYSYEEMSDRVTRTFEKHWDMVIKEVLSKMEG